MSNVHRIGGEEITTETVVTNLQGMGFCINGLVESGYSPVDSKGNLHNHSIFGIFLDDKFVTLKDWMADYQRFFKNFNTDNTNFLHGGFGLCYTLVGPQADKVQGCVKINHIVSLYSDIESIFKIDGDKDYRDLCSDLESLWHGGSPRIPLPYGSVNTNPFVDVEGYK